MTLYLDDGDVKLHHGDVLETLRALPAESVDCCVTSPPYWGLRSYLPDAHGDKPLELGLEKTPDEYVTRMVEVFREVRRVLKPTGTLFLNLGDAFEAKQLQGMPWKVAFALQAEGWYLRADIIWAKPNPMPESVTDRPTKAHEYVFLLSKQPRYFFDQEAVREAHKEPWRGNGESDRSMSPEAWDAAREDARRVGKATRTHEGESGVRLYNPAGRNVRSVWEIPTQPYPEAHFATFPEELVRRCILAGTSERGVCLECGKPWERTTLREAGFTNGSCNGCGEPENKHIQSAKSNMVTRRGEAVPCGATRTTGWQPSCQCARDREASVEYWTRPAVVLDPFAGSGTTLHVARKHNRHAIGIELNADYCKLAARRLQQLSLLAGGAA